MGRLSASLIALLLGAAATVLLSSCGGSGNSGLLPGATASQINSNLDKIPELVAAGECAGARSASAEISGQIEALEGVNGRLKEALGEGAARLDELVATCQEVPNGEEELEGIEAAEEAQAEEETEEKKEKPEKQGKPEKEKGFEKEEQQTEPPAEEKEEQETAPPAEGGGNTPSGGIGPGTPAGGG